MFKVTNRIGWYENIKIEFLTHYGHEYYCPLSLVRVHGMPMMEYYNLVERHGLSGDVEENSALEEHFLWPAEVRDEIIQPKLDATNDSDTIIMMPENDDDDDRQQIPMIQPLPEDEAYEQEEEQEPHIEPHLEKEKKIDSSTPGQAEEDDVAPLPAKTHTDSLPADDAPSITPGQDASEEPSSPHEQEQQPPPSQEQQQEQQQTAATSLASEDTEDNTSMEPTQERSVETEDVQSTRSHVSPESSESNVVSDQGNGTRHDPQTSSSVTPTATGTSPTHGVPMGSHTSSMMGDELATRVKAHAMHTKENAQESIYKTIMKRLNALELNATLSQRYLDEQTKMLNDAFLTMEKNHQDQLILLLGRLNDTASFRIDSMVSKEDPNRESV